MVLFEQLLIAATEDQAPQELKQDMGLLVEIWLLLCLPPLLWLRSLNIHNIKYSVTIDMEDIKKYT